MKFDTLLRVCESRQTLQSIFKLTDSPESFYVGGLSIVCESC